MTDRVRAPHPLLVARVLPRGAAIILRDYDAPDRAALAAQLQSVCEVRGLFLFVGADIDLAVRLGAKGIHLPSWFRPQNGIASGLTLSAACHDEEQLSAATGLGADIAFLSPAFPTASHPQTPGLGAADFLNLALKATLPVLALGGVDETNASRLAGPNVVGLAAIGAFYPAVSSLSVSTRVQTARTLPTESRK